MGKRVLRRKGGRDRRILWNGGEFNWKLVITVITSSSSRLGMGKEKLDLDWIGFDCKI